MSVELVAVAVNAGLLFLLIFVQQLHHDVAMGIPWTLGNRDGQEVNAAGARLQRTVRNHVEHPLPAQHALVRGHGGIVRGGLAFVWLSASAT
ncbi:MAG: hypothetical protein AAGA48_20825 [Myxococcota bacterium]